MPAPDPSFRFTPEQRATIRAGFDVAALERLVGMVGPEMREQVLESFPVRGSGTGWVELVELHDPELQAVLEEVWAPMWEHLPADALDKPEGYPYPGREIARRRRDA